MSIEMMQNFIMKLCNDFREDELLGLNSKGNQDKLVIYKFFFQSYIMSLLSKILNTQLVDLDSNLRIGIKKLCYKLIDTCQKLKLSNLGLSKLLLNAEESKNTNQRAGPARAKNSGLKEGRSSILGVIISLCMKTLVEIGKLYQDETGDGSGSKKDMPQIDMDVSDQMLIKFNFMLFD
jgi:hypothetical protein